ncbi:hypothetical protein ASD28_03300 [Massilia sp. Root133]|nr:hypothetical protein [Massilia sp. Root133]KQY11682.1 hypothetical protein ASD28_03300 [Massilia sp. Root133]KQZ46449.1 hypothetical protein ASD92_26490 [Massilia sp. Root1485]
MRIMAAGEGKAETAAMSSKLATLFARLRAVLPQLPPMPRAWVELRCARRLDRLAGRLQRMHARIARMQDHLTAAGAPGGPASDADGALRRMLAGLRAELARMRCDLALWHVRECGGECGTRLAAALARVNRIAVDTHAAAQRLEAELEARAE